MARIVDFVFHNILGLIVTMLTGTVMLWLLPADPRLADLTAAELDLLFQPLLQEASLSVVGSLGAFLGYVFFHMVCEALHGASLGKFLIGLTVCRQDGERASMPRTLLRSVGFFVDAFLFGAIGYISMAGSEQRQRYGDKWAKTIVLYHRATDWLRFGLVFLLATLLDALLIAASMLLALR